MGKTVWLWQKKKTFFSEHKTNYQKNFTTFFFGCHKTQYLVAENWINPD